MCCGNQRQQISNESSRASAPIAPTPAAVPPAAPRQARAATVFEYRGSTALTVVSPLTRKAYRFDRPGARLPADPRDTPWLSFVPQLVRAG